MLRLHWFRRPPPRALPSSTRSLTVAAVIGFFGLLSLSCLLLSPLWQLLEIDIGSRGIRRIAVVESFSESFSKRSKTAPYESADYEVEVAYVHAGRTYRETFPNKGYRPGDSVAVDISPLLPSYAVFAGTRKARSFGWDGVFFGAIFAAFFGFLATLVYLRYVRRPRRLLRDGVLAEARTVGRGRRGYRIVWMLDGHETEAFVPYLGVKGEKEVATEGARYEVAYLPDEPTTALPARVVLGAVAVRPSPWIGLVLVVAAVAALILIQYTGQPPLDWDGVVAEQGRAALCTMREVAQALERHEEAEGKLPETLSALVPRFLPREPRGPYGHPLAYERHQKTWDRSRSWVATLRCLGRDGREGAGEPPRQENDDILYQVRFPLYGMPLGD